MAGGFRRGNRKRLPKLEGRGELQSLEREGPFKEWLGMPDLYRYFLVVEGEKYSYQTEDAELPVAVGDKAGHPALVSFCAHPFYEIVDFVLYHNLISGEKLQLQL